jgi:transcriptional regulator with XRE-family HTH domain
MKDRIKQLRRTFHLTQQEFADRLGIKRGALANYEIGRNEPIDAVISLICREFRVSEPWLRTGEGEMFPTLSEDEHLAHFFGQMNTEGDIFRRRFLLTLSRMSDEEWRTLEALVQTIRKI